MTEKTCPKEKKVSSPPPSTKTLYVVYTGTYEDSHRVNIERTTEHSTKEFPRSKLVAATMTASVSPPGVKAILLDIGKAHHAFLPSSIVLSSITRARFLIVGVRLH